MENPGKRQEMHAHDKSNHNGNQLRAVNSPRESHGNTDGGKLRSHNDPI